MFDLLWNQHDFLIFASGCVLLWSAASWWLCRATGHRLAVILGWQFLALVLIPGWYMVDAAGEHESDRLKRLLIGYAPIYAQQFERMGHAQLANDTPANDPLYLRLIEEQKSWLAANPAIADIYTFRRLSDDRVMLLVDSETDYDRNGEFEGEREQRTGIGEIYANFSPALRRTFEQGSIEIDGLTTDRWGTWLSASVPLYDAQGNIEGVLGVDYPAREWMHAVAMARLSSIVFLGVLISILHGAIAIVTLQNSHIARYRSVAYALRSSLEQVAESRANMETQATLLHVKNRQLLAARHEAEQATRAKSDFLANMSHEIRTPMTAILGYAELLLDDELSPPKIGSLQTIQRNGLHLLEIINDILDLSKIEAGKVSLELVPCDVNEIIGDVQSLMRVRSDAKGLELTKKFDEAFPHQMLSDPTRLRQILINLVGNAIKFTERGSVHIAARQVSVTANEVTFEIVVADTGPGMSDTVLQRLFQPFTQADSSVTRRFGGTGLGLTISQRFAQLLGGGITVASKLGEGSEFTLRFVAPFVPREPTASEPHAPLIESVQPVAAAQLPTGVRILLAEDGPDNQRLISLLLRKAGAVVEVVENGQLAVDAVADAHRQGCPFDLVLMDMQMPVMDGYTATRVLREQDHLLPIVAITAHAMQGDRDKCVAAGCNGYTTKPIQRQAMLAAISQVLADQATPAAT